MALLALALVAIMLPSNLVAWTPPKFTLPPLPTFPPLPKWPTIPNFFERQSTTQEPTTAALPSSTPDHAGRTVEDACYDCPAEKYLQHYAARGCTPVHRFNCSHCPEKYECPIWPEMTADNPNYAKCEYGGRFYDIGQDVVMENNCRVCRCSGYPSLDDNSTSTMRPIINCASIECADGFGKKPYPPGGMDTEEGRQKNKNCYFVRSLDACCPVNTSCPTDAELPSVEICEYEGKKYKVGEFIYPSDDECRMCVCDEKWNAADRTQSTCRHVGCDIELRKNLLDKGCVPVYRDNVCCPTEYKCPPEDDVPAVCSLPIEAGFCLAYFPRYGYSAGTKRCELFIYGGCGGNGNRFSTPKECADTCGGPLPPPPSNIDIHPVVMKVDMSCKFGRKTVGHRESFAPQPCVDCECIVPPDVICKAKNCDPPQGKNCAVLPGISDGCCPVYQCRDS